MVDNQASAHYNMHNLNLLNYIAFLLNTFLLGLLLVRSDWVLHGRTFEPCQALTGAALRSNFWVLQVTRPDRTDNNLFLF
jgi:hypothetical protein